MFRGVSVGTLITMDSSGFNRELRRNRSQVRGWARDLESDAGRVGAGFGRLGGMMKSMARGLTIAGAAAATGIGYAVKKGAEFDAQMSRVKALAGATAKEFETLRDAAIDLGGKTVFSAKEAAQGMEVLAAAGLKPQAILKAMPGLLDAAAASGEEFNAVTDILVSTMNGFNLTAKDTGHIADVLASAANASSVSIADIGQSFKYVAPIAASAGTSLEETAAAIAILGNNGIKADSAGTALRMGLLRLARAPKPVQKSLKELNLTAMDTEGNMKAIPTLIGELGTAMEGMPSGERLKHLGQIFGAEAAPAWDKLIKEGKVTIDDLAKAFVNSEGAAKEMAETMTDNLPGAIEQFRGGLETQMIRVSDAIGKAFDLKGRVSGATEQLEGFGNATLRVVNAIGRASQPGKALYNTFRGLQLVVSGVIAGVMGAGREFMMAFRSASGLKGGADDLTWSFRRFAEQVGLLAREWLPKIGGALGSVTGFLVDHGTAVKNLVIVLGSAFVAYKALMIIYSIGSAVRLLTLLTIALTKGKMLDTLATLGWTKAHKAATAAIWLKRAALFALRGALLLTTRALRLATVGARALAMALIMNPVGAIITAIALLAIGLVVAYKRSETFRRIVHELWARLKQLWGILMDNKQVFLALLGPMGIMAATLITLWRRSDTFRNALKAVAAVLKGAVKTGLDWVKRGMLGLRDAVGWASDKVDALLKKLKPLADKLSKVADLAGKAASGVGAAVGWVGGKVGQIGDGVGDMALVGPKPGTVDAFTPMASRAGLIMTSAFRPGDPGWHGQNRARDYAGPAGKMLAFARQIGSVFGSHLKELIYTPLGWGIKNGKRVNVRSFYGPEVAANHFDHVHVAMQRGGLVPGSGFGDKIPALLEPGEGIINRNAVAAMGGPAAIHAINGAIPRFRRGGVASGKPSYKTGSIAGQIAAAELRADPTIAFLEKQETGLRGNLQTLIKNLAGWKNALPIVKQRRQKALADRKKAKTAKEKKRLDNLIDKLAKDRDSLQDKIKDAPGRQRDMADEIVRIQQQIKDLREQAKEEAAAAGAALMLQPDLDLEAALAQAEQTETTSDDIAIRQAQLGRAQQETARLRAALADPSLGAQERNDLLAALADSLRSETQLKGQIKDLIGQTSEGTLTGTGETAGSTLADLVGQLQALASSLNILIRDEQGNVFGRTQIVNNFQQQPNADHWTETMQFQLQKVGA